MINLLEAINLLPKELQDLIGEYNVNHREMMYQVHNELFKNIIHYQMQYVYIELKKNIYRYGCIKCDNCFCWVYEDDILKKTVYFRKIECCSEICKYNFERKFIKRLKQLFPSYNFEK